MGAANKMIELDAEQPRIELVKLTMLRCPQPCCMNVLIVLSEFLKRRQLPPSFQIVRALSQKITIISAVRSIGFFSELGLCQPVFAKLPQ